MGMGVKDRRVKSYVVGLTTKILDKLYPTEETSFGTWDVTQG